MVSPCEDAKGMQIGGWQRRPHRKPVQGAQSTQNLREAAEGWDPRAWRARKAQVY